MRTIDIETLKGCLEEDAIILDGLDDAIVGVDNNNYIVYSYIQLLKHYMFSGMSQSDATEYVEYNILSLATGNKFVVLYDLDYM